MIFQDKGPIKLYALAHKKSEYSPSDAAATECGTITMTPNFINFQKPQPPRTGSRHKRTEEYTPTLDTIRVKLLNPDSENTLNNEDLNFLYDHYENGGKLPDDQKAALIEQLQDKRYASSTPARNLGRQTGLITTNDFKALIKKLVDNQKHYNQHNFFVGLMYLNYWIDLETEDKQLFNELVQKAKEYKPQPNAALAALSTAKARLTALGFIENDEAI